MSQQHINVSTPNDGLGNTLRNAFVKTEANFTELYTNKVDKVTGKDLSDTNFTQVEKDKLAALDASFQVQSDFGVTDSGNPAFILNKPLNTSDFTNDGATGATPFVEDVTIGGQYARQSGSWVAITVNPIQVYDGIIGITSGFTVGQVAFALPSGAKCVDVFLNGALQYKTTANNNSLVNRWSQSGDVVTITKTTVLNNYIYIKYQ